MPAHPATLTIHDVSPNLIAFYDGRTGTRFHSPGPNWVDDGGYALGIASYAVHNGTSAIVYDTHLSLAHARAIRNTLEARGIRDLRVVLSHWHLDHVAGNEVFKDCEIIAHDETLRLLEENKEKIEAGTLDGPPPIKPLVLPTATFDTDITLDVGGLEIELRPLDIHSRDGVALYIAHDGTLLVGDTLEDTITYVDEPDRLEDHLIDLARLEAWSFTRMMPNHGSKERITGGGYGRSLIHATRAYIELLLKAPESEELAAQDLKTFLAEPLRRDWVDYFAPYEEVHRMNVAKVLALTT
jgi:glyoxylase-like metal-dependent hydrolase (beta-lactamase superfamily II)